MQPVDLSGKALAATEAHALVGGHINDELIARNEYLATESRILKTRLNQPVRFNDSERVQLANTFDERWVRSVKEECLSRLIFFGKKSLRTALKEYVRHYHEERNHQGKYNKLLSPPADHNPGEIGEVRCRERLGGLLKHYYRGTGT